MRGACGFLRGLTAAVLAVVVCLTAGCQKVRETAGLSVVPKSLGDVPANRLAFRFETDVAEDKLPERLRHDEAEEPLAAIKTAFETQRTTDALIRTVTDPSGQRALALYGTSNTETDFRIDLYSAEGQFIRNVLPPDLTGVFPLEVSWSPDGQSILFSGIRNPSLAASPTPTPEDFMPPPPALSQPGEQATPAPAPSAAPIIPSVPVFGTEQLYVGDRDGYNLRPLTTRDGLIYFKPSWSPDGQHVAALACKEDEWSARRREGLLPAGRPRIISLSGQERLLDDRLTEVTPSWSPDGSKVATAFEYEVAVYDATGSQPTGGALSFKEPLRAASVEYDARVFKKSEPQAVAPKADAPKDGAGDASANAAQASGETILISLNPFIRLEWAGPEIIYAQTAFVHFYRDDPLPTFKYMRWHAVHVYPQAAVLSRAARSAARVT